MGRLASPTAPINSNIRIAAATATEDELIEFCKRNIVRFKRPRIVKFVESLPKTPVGKIQKNELRQPYWAGHEKMI